MQNVAETRGNRDKKVLDAESTYPINLDPPPAILPQQEKQLFVAPSANPASHSKTGLQQVQYLKSDLHIFDETAIEMSNNHTFD